MLTFPQLSRAMSLKTKETTLDPTLRDSYENGMVSTRARYLRRRRHFNVSLDLLTLEDKATLDNFVQNQAVFGANIFLFADPRDPHNPQNYRVRFSTLPAYNDAGYTDGEYRQNCTFVLEEV